MKVLVACEESQAVTTEFRKLGHEAYSCDILDQSGGFPEYHIKSDVLPLLNGDCSFETTDGIRHNIIGQWDMIIAFPPCTFLTNTGMPYLNIEKYGDKAIERLKSKKEAENFFMKFTKAKCNRIAIENPIGCMNKEYRMPDQIIQPWAFGHKYIKSTCLWLKNLPNLIPFVKNKPDGCKNYALETKYDDDGKAIKFGTEKCRMLRSKTFPGVAKAMAEQWSNFKIRKERLTKYSIKRGEYILIKNKSKQELINYIGELEDLN